jgi:hypothetical protein
MRHNPFAFGLAVAFLVMVEGRLAHRAGRPFEAQQLLAGAAGFARVALIRVRRPMS